MALACAIAVVALSALVAAAPPREAAASATDRMIRTLNDVRARHGKPPLRPAGALLRSSTRFARSLMRRDVFAHGPSIAVSRRYRAAGETLAMHRGRRLAVRRTVRQWMHSPPHRAVLLSSRYRMVGVGSARGRFGRTPSTIWVAHVAR
jgi:uncharacterized protein YkwD